jgi:hypothetical protein
MIVDAGTLTAGLTSPFFRLYFLLPRAASHKMTTWLLAMAKRLLLSRDARALTILSVDSPSNKVLSWNCDR